ncbi:hypothetical protein RJ640_000888 [Escallonia rubra]|uniref:Retrovirus-related Pol polyprotein from transposon TNT 1-94-like beta-barrel domain-containing protein n=1 Tax=Escallonia rubra TaxID=112253 RepID=A0AA88QWD9_9ASTE|nr:hypothetical protein RJ640_000888 [Escallonia rubra]
MEERNNFAPAEEKNMEDAIFLTYRGNEKCKKNVWYLDTGASNHMCGRKELFTDLDETIKGEVTFGDSSKIPMKGKGMFTNFKKAMTKEFEMTDISKMSYFFGVEVKQMEDGIFMSQKKYAEQILSRFRMKDCNPVAIPAETDSNYGRDLDDRKSTSGYAFHIGSAIFSWSSKKQQIVALSTCEAEYIAAAACTCQAIWLKNILKELYLIEEGPTTIYVDNKSAITLAKNPLEQLFFLVEDLLSIKTNISGRRENVELFVAKVMKSSTLLCSVTYQATKEDMEEAAFGKLLNPLAYSRSGDQVLQSHNNTRLSWYDLVKMEFRNVKVCGLPSWLYAGVCVESLVSLNGYGEESETDAFFLKNYKLVRLKKAQNLIPWNENLDMGGLERGWKSYYGYEAL